MSFALKSSNYHADANYYKRNRKHEDKKHQTERGWI